jgi:hypothetical protein
MAWYLISSPGGALLADVLGFNSEANNVQSRDREEKTGSSSPKEIGSY